MQWEPCGFIQLLDDLARPGGRVWVASTNVVEIF